MPVQESIFTGHSLKCATLKYVFVKYVLNDTLV